jgi:transcriptional regulator with XRE-family HTH domain
MGRDERGGERLDRVLNAHGLNRNKLAKIANVAPTTVQKWYASLERGDIKEDAWLSCANALQRAKIDPDEVRPGAPIPTHTSVAELVYPILSIDSPDVLTLLLKVLSLESDDDKATARALVNSQLKKL